MNVQQEYPQDAQNGPHGAVGIVSDAPVMQYDTTPGEAEIERQRVCEDITRMAYTLIRRTATCDDATRARIQRRLVSLVTDTQPEVDGGE